MQHRLFFSSVVAVVLALFMGASAAAQSGSNARYYQFADTAAASISTPAAGRVRLFFDSTGFYWKNSAGVSTAVGGSSISGTAGVIPAIATGGTTLEDSKMTTTTGGTSTGKGVWTLYDNTATNGVSSIVIRQGAADVNNAANYLLKIIPNSGAGTYGGIVNSIGGVSIQAFDFRDPAASSFVLSSNNPNGLGLGPTIPILWGASVPYLGYDVGLVRGGGVGILQVTDGSTGQGGIGIADSATNTVSDALILRHQGGTTLDGFGTGLLFQGENEAGVMHDIASIQAIYEDNADGSEDSRLRIALDTGGVTNSEIAAFTYNGIAGGLPGIIGQGAFSISSVGDMHLLSGGTQYLYSNGTVRWQNTTTAFAPWVTNTYDIGTSSLGVKDIYAAGLAVSDAATNTVTDAIALRHATSGTATTGFGTGLLFQGEDAAGNMQDMASIDAVYIAATDTAEEVDLKFYTMKAGAEDLAMTIGADFFGTGAKSLESPGDLYVYAAGGNLFLGGGNVEWEVADTALRPVTTNSNTIGTSSLLMKDAYVSTSIQGTRTQAISDNAAAATFVTVAVPTSDTTVGGRIFYTITAIDAGTAIQTKTGTYSFGLNNIGGTVTGAGTDVLEHSQLSAGTLDPTFSVNISGTNAQFQLVLDTSLDAAAETLKIEYRVQIDSGTATVTPAT